MPGGSCKPFVCAHWAAVLTECVAPGLSAMLFSVMNSLPLLLAAAAAGDMENHRQLTSWKVSLTLLRGLHDEACAAASSATGDPRHSWVRERSSAPCPARNMVNTVTTS
jgi:hypothetical protein